MKLVKLTVKMAKRTPRHETMIRNLYINPEHILWVQGAAGFVTHIHIVNSTEVFEVEEPIDEVLSLLGAVPVTPYGSRPAEKGGVS